MIDYNQKLAIKAWAEADRPREKLMQHGRRQLSDAELIAILISSGSKNESAVELSKRILNAYQNDLIALGKASVTDLCKFKGIGQAKAIAIVAALELSRRRKDTPDTALKKITYSKDAYQILAPNFIDLNYEEFWILLLNRSNFVIGQQLISKGGQAGTVADPKIIFKTAIEFNAAYVVLAHNHPSGNLKPSSFDLDLTKKLIEAGKMLDLLVADHLIITDKAYLSFRDEGLM